MNNTPDDTPPLDTQAFINQRLFNARTLVITGEVNQKLAATVMSQLLALSAESVATTVVQEL